MKKLKYIVDSPIRVPNYDDYRIIIKYPSRKLLVMRTKPAKGIGKISETVDRLTRGADSANRRTN